MIIIIIFLPQWAFLPTFCGVTFPFLYFHFSVILLSVSRIAYRWNSSKCCDVIALQRNYSHPLAREPLRYFDPELPCTMLRFVLKLRCVRHTQNTCHTLTRWFNCIGKSNLHFLVLFKYVISNYQLSYENLYDKIFTRFSRAVKKFS